MKSTICDNEWLKKDKAPNYHLFKQAINIVDLFSGCGGLTLGAIEACYHNHLSSQIQLAVECNDTAANAYKDNFLNDKAQLYKGNIENLISNNPGDPLSDAEFSLQKKLQNVDILLAGPPCQGHSRLNNHTRLIDPRNKLYLKVIRFVELCRPQFIIIENVLNIKYDANNVLKNSADFLETLGYNVNNITVKTVEFGVAQNRVRHIQIASLDNFDISLEQYKSSSVLKNVIDDIMDNYKQSTEIFDTPSVTKHQERIDHLFDNELYDLPDELRPDCHKHKKHTYYTSYGRLKWDEPGSTITRGFSTMGQGRFVHPLRKRTLTPHEAARIQGFPDFFRFNAAKKRGELHLMIANAVPPKISAMLVDAYLSHKKGTQNGHQKTA